MHWEAEFLLVRARLRHLLVYRMGKAGAKPSQKRRGRKQIKNTSWKETVSPRKKLLKVKEWQLELFTKQARCFKITPQND
jgi:hypothetical protein